jgi:hypothetical protein
MATVAYSEESHSDSVRPVDPEIYEMLTHLEIYGDGREATKDILHGNGGC